MLVLAAAAYYELSSRGSSVFGAAGRRVDSLVLLFPVLLLAGGSGLFARVVLGGRFLRGAAPRLPTPAWLAARRLAASRYRAVAVVAGASMSIGLVLFAGSMSASLRATIDAKAKLAPGSAQILRLEDPASLSQDDPLVPDLDLGDSDRRRHPPSSGATRPPTSSASIPTRSSRRPTGTRASQIARSPSLLSGLGPVVDGQLPALAVGDGLPDDDDDRARPARTASSTCPSAWSAGRLPFPGSGSRALVRSSSWIVTRADRLGGHRRRRALGRQPIAGRRGGRPRRGAAGALGAAVGRPSPGLAATAALGARLHPGRRPPRRGRAGVRPRPLLRRGRPTPPAWETCSRGSSACRPGPGRRPPASRWAR